MNILNPYFEKDCRELVRGYLGAGETLVWVRECGYQDRFGYVVLTNTRVITAVFNPEVLFGTKRERVNFYTPKRSLVGKLLTFHDQRSTYLAPEYELSEQENKTRTIYEVPLVKIQGIEREDYLVKLKTGETTMVELTFLVKEGIVIDRPLLYTKGAGDELYTLMQNLLATIKDTGQQQSDENKASLIASLTELHEAGVLSDEEFEAKKQAILANE